MAARVLRKIALLVISLIVAVISLPMTAAAISMPTWAKPLVAVGSELKAPIRVAVAGDGTFYVSDPRHGGVLKYNPAGVLLSRITTTGVPQSLAVLPNGNLVVTVNAFGNSYASIVDTISGLEITRLKSSVGGPVASFGFADGVTVDELGNIYIVDTHELKVKVFGANGVYSSEFNCRGAAPLASGIPSSVPSGITYEKNSQQLVVVDKFVFGDVNGRNIRFYNKDGTYVRGIGTNGTAIALKFATPQSVAFQYNTDNTVKRMYVVDTYNSTIQIIDSKTAGGTFLGFMGDYGFDGAKGELHLPADAAFDQARKRLIVVNGNGNVIIYGVDGGISPVVVVPPAPTLSVVQPFSIVNSPSLTINGDVTPGASVACVLNGVPVAWDKDNADGKWSCAVSGLLENIGGNGVVNEIAVFAQNASPTVDKKIVSVKYIASVPNLNVDPSSVPYYTKSDKIKLFGKVSTGATVQACNPKTTCVSAQVTDIDGTNASWTLLTGQELALALGSNDTIEVTAVNGGSARQTVHNVIYDAVPPKLKVSVVENGAVVRDQIQNITGLVSDPDGNLEGVTVYSYDGAITNSQQATLIKNGIFSVAMTGVTSYNVVARDLAGNEKWFPGPDANAKNTISYDPTKVKIRITSPDVADASVVTVASGQSLSGTIDRPLASLLVKGVSAEITGLTWTARFNMDYDSVTKDGLNDVQIVASDGSRSKATLVYDPSNPEATIVEPKMDIATNSPSYVMKAQDGTAVILSRTFQGDTIGIPSNKDFTVAFEAEATYPVILSADDSNGASSQVVRNIIYDTTPPKLDYSPKYYSTSCEGVPAGNPCPTICPATNGVCSNTAYSGTIEPGASVTLEDPFEGTAITDPVTYSNSGKTWAATLAAGRDPYNTRVIATDAAGNITRSFPVSPDGNMTVDNYFNQGDVQMCLDKVAAYGPKVAPDYPKPFDVLTPQQLAHGDVAPLINGNPSPDGYIDIVDCLLLNRKMNGYSVPF